MVVGPNICGVLYSELLGIYLSIPHVTFYKYDKIIYNIKTDRFYNAAFLAYKLIVL
jgi:hypothetical protein